MKRKHVMIDFETYSTHPNAVPLSLGAVAFDADGISEKKFYINIDRNDAIALGMHVLPATVSWWEKQSEEAKAALIQEPVVTVIEALTLFTHWTREVGGLYLWGNGADFDNPILRSCFVAIDADMPFKPYNGRCYRTIKSIPGMPRMEKRMGTHHNALDDAESQAIHLIEMNKVMKVLE